MVLFIDLEFSDILIDEAAINQISYAEIKTDHEHK